MAGKKGMKQKQKRKPRIFVRKKNVNRYDRAITDLYAGNRAAGEKFLSEIFEAMSEMQGSKVFRKVQQGVRPKGVYNQGGSYIKLIEKYS